jgi:hypothetical protein
VRLAVCLEAMRLVGPQGRGVGQGRGEERGRGVDSAFLALLLFLALSPCRCRPISSLPSLRPQDYTFQETEGSKWCTALQSPPLTHPSNSTAQQPGAAEAAAPEGEGSGIVLNGNCGSSPVMLLRSFSSTRAPGQSESGPPAPRGLLPGLGPL